MLIIDPEECIDCGACEPECPVEAIFPEDALPDKWEPFVKINYAYSEGADGVEPARRRVRDRAQRREPATRLGVTRPRTGTTPPSATEGGVMPPKAWSAKRERQYEHIKDSLEERGTRRTRPRRSPRGR